MTRAPDADLQAENARLREAAENILADFKHRRYAPDSDPLSGAGLVPVTRTKLRALRAALNAPDKQEM